MHFVIRCSPGESLHFKKKYTQNKKKQNARTHVHIQHRKQLSVSSFQSPDCGGLFFDPKDYFPYFAAQRAALTAETTRRMKKRKNAHHVSSFVIGILLTPHVYRETLVRARRGVHYLQPEVARNHFNVF